MEAVDAVGPAPEWNCCFKVRMSSSTWDLSRSRLIALSSEGLRLGAMTAGAVGAAGSATGVGTVRCTKVEIVRRRRSSRRHILYRSDRALLLPGCSLIWINVNPCGDGTHRSRGRCRAADRSICCRCCLFLYLAPSNVAVSRQNFLRRQLR